MNATLAFRTFLALLVLLCQFGAAAQDKEPKTPKIPGDTYTNGVGMVLLKLPGGYWAGKFEVTQKQYREVMGGNPSAFQDDDRPVDSVSWNDAMEFCRRITEDEIRKLELPTGFTYSLPDEGQWNSWAASADLKDAVTSQSAPRGGTEKVGSLGANAQGLHDVRGNVMEFCLGDTSKPYRVVKGGSWQDRIEVNLRPEFHYYCKPDEKQNTFGFRCILTGP